MTGSSTDRIEKQILIKAPRARVWRAIADAKEFGEWFGVRLEGPFEPGAPLKGRIVPTTADPEVARVQKPHEGMPFEITVDRIESERLLSFRWHPFAIEPGVDYSSEPTTLVEFVLEEVAGGTLLKVVESGFDRIPLARRVKAFTANEQGWTKVVTLVEKHLARSA